MTHIGQEITFCAVGGFRRELGVQGRLLGVLAVRDDLGRAGQAQRGAVRGAFGLRPRAQPLVVPGLVARAKLHVVGGVLLAVVIRAYLDFFPIIGMNQFLKDDVGGAEVADAVAQHFLEAQSEPGLIGDEVDFPQSILGAAHRALEAALYGIERRFRALQVADVDDGAGDAHHVAGLAARHRGFFADPAFAAAVEHHAVFTAVGRILGGGLHLRRAHTPQVIGMNP